MKTLVIYASKHGTSAKCADLLSQSMKDNADVLEIKKAEHANLSQYEKIIIGGSIYVGKIQKEISDFCARNLDLLKSRKIGLYICSLAEKDSLTQMEASFPRELLEAAAAKENFGGEMRFSAMNFAMRTMMKMFSKSIAKSDPRFSDIDGKKDVSLLLNENIDRFVRQMNSI